MASQGRGRGYRQGKEGEEVEGVWREWGGGERRSGEEKGKG